MGDGLPLVCEPMERLSCGEIKSRKREDSCTAGRSASPGTQGALVSSSRDETDDWTAMAGEIRSAACVAKLAEPQAGKGVPGANGSSPKRSDPGLSGTTQSGSSNNF